jgi:hypothetical protein
MAESRVVGLGDASDVQTCPFASPAGAPRRVSRGLYPSMRKRNAIPPNIYRERSRTAALTRGFRERNGMCSGQCRPYTQRNTASA